MGFFVQQQFGWKDRLFLTGAIRADDNSAFGEDFDVVYYPKLSGSWVIVSTWAFSLLAVLGIYGLLRVRANGSVLLVLIAWLAVPVLFQIVVNRHNDRVS